MPQIKMVFRDTLSQRTASLNLQAVWEEVVEHLTKFLDTDAAAAKHGIRSKAENLVVPQPIIEFVIGHVKAEYVGKLQQQLDNIDRSEVHVQEDPRSEEQDSRKAASQGRSAQAEGHRPSVRPARTRGAGRAHKSGQEDKQGSE